SQQNEYLPLFSHSLEGGPFSRAQATMSRRAPERALASLFKCPAVDRRGGFFKDFRRLRRAPGCSIAPFGPLGDRNGPFGRTFSQRTHRRCGESTQPDFTSCQIASSRSISAGAPGGCPSWRSFSSSLWKRSSKRRSAPRSASS